MRQLQANKWAITGPRGYELVVVFKSKSESKNIESIEANSV